MRFRSWWVSAMVLTAAASVLACGPEAVEPSVVRVPDDYATIQAAVNAAAPGDLVLVGTGIYHESVTVRTPDITIRGVDRNVVVLDGEHELTDGIAVIANGVVVENLTVRNYEQHGVLFDGTRVEGADGDAGDDSLVGYRVSYVTTANNGRSGIHVVVSRDGLIEHVVASGHPESGIVVGRCQPCNVVVTDSLAENNAIGYSGDNAFGSVFVVSNVFRRNRLGMAPNSGETQQLVPEVETVIAGNLVVENDNRAAPAVPDGFFGEGIAIGGGAQNTVLRNRVTGHDIYGIGLVTLNDSDPIGNRIEGNVVTGNGVDLYYELRPGDVATFDNCFTLNEFQTSKPEEIEIVLGCDIPAGPVTPQTVAQPEPPPNVDYRQIPLPGPQTVMPGDVAAIPTEAAGASEFPDLDAISVPPG